MNEYTVTDEEIAEFHRDGFLIARGLFDEPEMNGLLRYAKGDRDLAAASIVRRDATAAGAKAVIGRL